MERGVILAIQAVISALIVTSLDINLSDDLFYKILGILMLLSLITITSDYIAPVFLFSFFACFSSRYLYKLKIIKIKDKSFGKGRCYLMIHGTQKYEIGMCEGPLLPKIVKFSIPLILTGNLQLLYNAINIVIVGRFVGSLALSAVGSSISIIYLFTNLFIGLSVGSGLVMAKYYGAQQYKDTNDTVHTTIAISCFSGIIIAVFGVLTAKPILLVMGTPVDILDSAVLYLRIYLLGMPAVMVFNFSSAILRAVGDTRRPLYFLSISGIVNVILNLIFVIIVHMEIAGVAISTVISQYISVVLIMICLVRSGGCAQLRCRNIRIHKDKVIAILKIGIPAGLQGILFSLSNVVIQSAVNSFGSVVVAGNAAAMNIESFVAISMEAFYQAALAFTGQNIGAKKYNRISSILRICLILVTFVGISLGGLSYLFAKNLLGIFTFDPQVIDVGSLRMVYTCAVYFLYGAMVVLVGVLRGMGYSVLPTLVSVIGVCGIRIVWVYTVFAAKHTLAVLYISFPISWVLTSFILIICLVYIRRNLTNNANELQNNLSINDMLGQHNDYAS